MNSPCAACKLQRRKCTPDCEFAPYFPADQPKRFAVVHMVFGGSKVAKILKDVDSEHREEAVKSLVYEAEARLVDPVYGCVGLISVMQNQLKALQLSLEDGKKELASLVGSGAGIGPYNIAQIMVPCGSGSGPVIINSVLQHQLILEDGKEELASLVGPTHYQNMGSGAGIGPYDMAQIMMPSRSGSGPVVINSDPQHQIGHAQIQAQYSCHALQPQQQHDQQLFHDPSSSWTHK